MRKYNDILILKSKNNVAGKVNIYVKNDIDGWYQNLSSEYHERLNPEFIELENIVLKNFDLRSNPLVDALMQMTSKAHGGKNAKN